MTDLLDRFRRPLRDLRISVIDRCNYRCPYCMPASEYGEDYPFIDPPDRLSTEETVRLARLFVGVGVSKLRVTGGEPLLRKDIAELVGQLAAIEGVEDLALTTNGALLARHAEALLEAGLRRLTVSIDSLDPDVFARLSGGRGDLQQVLNGLAVAREAGFPVIKVNTVVQRGVNEDGVLDLLEHFRDSEVIVRFIEYMDVGTCNGWRSDQVVSSAELIERIGRRWPLTALGEQYYGEVATRYAYADGQGEIGFVSSISQPFCGSCTRARLSSEGSFYTCLFAHQGLDLRGPLRDGEDDEALLARIAGRWNERDDRYSEQRGRQDRDTLKVEMYRVGG